MQAAETARATLLKEAREIAQDLGRRNGLVTADDVYRVMIQRNLPIVGLGPAAGSIFRDNSWTFTGQWKKSLRVSNHARMIRVWAYTGQPTSTPPR